VPANNRIRFYDDQALVPPRKPLIGKNPEAAICIPELRSGLTPFENNQLLPETEVFGD